MAPCNVQHLHNALPARAASVSAPVSRVVPLPVLACLLAPRAMSSPPHCVFVRLPMPLLRFVLTNELHNGVDLCFIRFICKFHIFHLDVACIPFKYRRSIDLVLHICKFHIFHLDVAS